MTASSADMVMVRLGLRASYPALTAALGELRWTRGRFATVDGVDLFTWPDPVGRPARMLVDVVRVAGLLVAPAWSWGVPLTPRPVVADEVAPVVVTASEGPVELGEAVVVGDVTWRRVAGIVGAREVVRLRADSSPVFADVDVSVAPWVMTCRCGRVRYVRGNSRHQVDLCRVCTRAARLRMRSLAQFRSRHV